MLFGVGAASAAAKTLTWKGNFPIIGEQTVTTVVNAEIPATAKPGQTLDVPFSLDVDAGPAAAEGLRLVGATTLSGSISSKVNFTDSAGNTTPVDIKLPIPETPVPQQGPLKFTAKGAATITIPQNAATGPAQSAVAASASTHVETDSDQLDKFDVQLSLAPPDQDTVLGETKVG